MFNLKFTVTFDKAGAAKKLRDVSMARLRDAARFFREQVEANAPVDTGKLKSSVKIIPKANGISLHVDVHYAMFQEFGYTHYISGRWIPGKAYIRRAAATTHQRYPWLYIEVKPMGKGR